MRVMPVSMLGCNEKQYQDGIRHTVILPACHSSVLGAHPFIGMLATQALSQALAQFPDVNATLQSDMRAVVRHRHHNIGVAIATPTGLVVRPARTSHQRTLSYILP